MKLAFSVLLIVVIGCHAKPKLPEVVDPEWTAVSGKLLLCPAEHVCKYECPKGYELRGDFDKCHLK